MGAVAALSMGLPLALFTLTGHQELGLVALLGGFTVLYGDRLRLGERMKLLPLVGLGFVLASMLGVACSVNGWLLAICLVLVAALACAISFGVRLGPPGPMFFVLVAGLSGHMAASATDSAGLLLIPAMVAVGAAAACLVAVFPLLLPRVRRAEGPAHSLRRLFPRTPFDREVTIIMIRVVAAVALAGMISLPLGVHRTYWVALVAGVVLQASHVMRATITRSVHRVLGTLLGLGIFWLIVRVQPAGLWLVLVIAMLQFATEVVITRNYALGLLFITPMALIIAATGQESAPLVVVSDRVIDTLLGTAIAMGLLLVEGWVRSRPTSPS